MGITCRGAIGKRMGERSRFSGNGERTSFVKQDRNSQCYSRDPTTNLLVAADNSAPSRLHMESDAAFRLFQRGHEFADRIEKHLKLSVVFLLHLFKLSGKVGMCGEQ